MKKKLVKEFLYEKFEEDSDPVKDLGIGVSKYQFNLLKWDSYGWQNTSRVVIIPSRLFDDAIIEDHESGSKYYKSITIGNKTWHVDWRTLKKVKPNEINY